MKADLRLDAFTAPQTTIAGRLMQPFSAGRLQLCRKIGLRLVAGGEGMEQDEIERELAAFWFIHTAPLEAVKTACALGPEQFFAQHGEELLFTLPAAALPQIMDFLAREFSAVNAAEVEVVDKPGEGKGAQPPKNS